MRLIRVGLVSIDNTIGAVDANTTKAVSRAHELDKLRCTVGVFQEQLFGGYPAEDLVQHPEFISEQWRALQRFAEETRGCNTVFVVGIAVRDSGFVYNASAVVHEGVVLGIVPKEHLPTYGVFYEKRVFTAGQPGLYRELAMEYETSAEQGTEKYQVSHRVPFGDLVFEFPFGTMATCTCEDAWTPDGPLARRAIALLHAIPNASPARQGVGDTRHQMLATRSADHECVLAAAYAVGGNDSLVFDGGGYVFQNGQLIGTKERFVEGVTIFDVDLSRTERMRNQNSTWRTRQEGLIRQGETFRRINVPNGPDCLPGLPSREFAERFGFLPEEPEPRKQALLYLAGMTIGGLAGYFEKSKAFKKILISLSGGKDSQLTLILAYLYVRRVAQKRNLSPEEEKRFIRETILCVSQPTKFNSAATRSIAEESCEELGVNFFEESIEEEYQREIAKVRAIAGVELDKTTRGNVQARIRGERMWNLSNALQGLWLQTGNMSEKAVGYTTIGGDLMGGYSLIGNMPKTVVIELISCLGETYGLKFVGPLLQTRASAELAEGQFDEDDLMPFPVLDLCFLLFAGELYAPADIYRVLRARWTDKELKTMQRSFTGTDTLKAWVEKFVRLFRTSIFKWVQAPQSVHLGSLDLDRERALQIPVITSGEWLERSLEEMRKL